jgi:hypothetical protein
VAAPVAAGGLAHLSSAQIADGKTQAPRGSDGSGNNLMAGMGGALKDRPAPPNPMITTRHAVDGREC